MPPHPTDKAGPAPAAVAGPNIKRLLIPALIAGVVVGGGAGAAILLTRPPKPPARVRVDAAAVAPRPAADAAPATASPADAAGPAPADGAAAAAEMVHNQFHVVPARAKIFVDGQLLEGGNKLDVPRSTAARKVRFEADGYHQKEIDLVPDYDQDLAIDLIAKAAPAAASDRSQPTAKPPVVVEKPPVGKPPVVAKPPVAKPPVIAKPKTGPAKTGKSKKPRIFTKI